MPFLYYFHQYVFQLQASIGIVTADFLKYLVNVSNLSEPQNEDIIRVKPSVTPILLAGNHWTRL